MASEDSAEFWAEVDEAEVKDARVSELDALMERLEDEIDEMESDGQEADKLYDLFHAEGNEAMVEKLGDLLDELEQGITIARQTLGDLQDEQHGLEPPWEATIENCPERFLEY